MTLKNRNINVKVKSSSGEITRSDPAFDFDIKSGQTDTFRLRVTRTAYAGKEIFHVYKNLHEL